MKLVVAFITALLTSFLLIPAAHADNRADAEKRLMVEEPYEAPAGVLFDEAAYFAGQTALSQYVNVIVINKAAKAQSLRFYTNRQLILTTKVSTGKEDVEYVNAVSKFLRRFGKGTTVSHWRHTTRGFYTVKRVEGADYRSGESKFQMPYAMFFNEQKGLAVHQVPPDLKGGEAAGEAVFRQLAGRADQAQADRDQEGANRDLDRRDNAVDQEVAVALEVEERLHAGFPCSRDESAAALTQQNGRRSSQKPAAIEVRRCYDVGPP